MKALAFLLALAPSLVLSAPLKPGDAIDVPRASGPALTLRVGARERVGADVVSVLVNLGESWQHVTGSLRDFRFCRVTVTAQIEQVLSGIGEYPKKAPAPRAPLAR